MSSKISELTTITDLTTAGYFPVVQSGVNRKISSATLDLRYKNVINIKEPPFNAANDSVTDDTAAIQAALTAAATSGGVVYVPGTSKVTGKITMPSHTALMGGDPHVSQLVWDGVYTGDGIVTVSPINSSTNVHTEISNLGLQSGCNTNIGGAYADTGGTYLYFRNNIVSGFKYGTILDQSEIVVIDSCLYQSQLSGGAGIWLVNGQDRTVGAQNLFTNRILINGCQINETTTVIGVMDDGGANHSITNNNFEGCSNYVRFLASACALFANNECEDSADHGIHTDNTTTAGTVVTQNASVVIMNNNINTGRTGKWPINLNKGLTYTLIGGNLVPFDGSGGNNVNITVNGIGSLTAIGVRAGAGGTLFNGLSNVTYTTILDVSDLNGGITTLQGLTLRNGAQWVSGTAAPVSGAHVQGEIVWQSAPSSGGFIGFVCTAAGTPGTWKTFGAIS